MHALHTHPLDSTSPDTPQTYTGQIQSYALLVAKEIHKVVLAYLQPILEFHAKTIEFFTSFHHPIDAERLARKKKHDLVRYKPWSQLNDAAYFHFNDRLLELLRTNSSTQQDIDKSTPLHAAALSGNLLGMSILIGSNARVNATEMRGQTPVHWAARHGHASAIHLLYAAGANIDALDERGKTPLRIAAKKGHFEAVLALLSLNAKVNNQDWKRQTPYFCALLHGHIRVAQLLRNFGADPTIANREGKLPSEIVGKANWLAFLRSIFWQGPSIELPPTLQYRFYVNMLRII